MFRREQILWKGVADMWTRKSVKQKGKGSFFKNFWKCVLVALILSVVIGATSNGYNGGAFPAFTNNFRDSDITDVDPSDVDIDTGDHGIDISYTDDNGNTHHIIEHAEEGIGIALAIVFLVAFVIAMVVSVIALAVKYFLIVPFEYGCRKFFRKNLEEPAKLSNIVYVFDSHYKNIVLTAFMTNLFISLWSLLFIIPGIIKSYEYRLVPYIMSEDPSMKFKDALAESKKLMNGNKWKSFVLDLSFLGWDILSLCTFGILGIFFVNPYKASTDAALYESIKYGIDAK